jgi:glucosamine--fructose-6-phosphate aminotransferase (isomerizing)
VALRDEIGEQPAVVERLLDEGVASCRPIVAAARKAGVEYVVIAARGTSDHAAIYAQYAFGAVARAPVALATPSLLTRYGVAPRVGRALVLGISQSGRSPDIVAVLADARRQGAVTAALTNDPTSPLADAAQHVVPLLAGPEASVAATKTYTASLAIVAMLAALLVGDRLPEELLRVPDRMRRALAAEPMVAAQAGAHRSMEEAVVLGRGFNLATALEWALKLKELAYVRAQAYSTADFQHGPSASLPPGGQLLAVSARGSMRRELLGVLRRMRAERGTRVLLVSGEAGDARRAEAHLPFPDDLPEWLSPLVAILPLQLFCYHLARAKGIDVEAPRGLTKVTLTH